MTEPIVDPLDLGPLEDALLDRLVDGELSDSVRRQLLERLETTPGGWRRCAVAFLEAQLWCAAFRPLGAAPRAQASVIPARDNGTSKAAHALFWGKATALLAVILLAFALGRGFHGNSTLPGPQISTAPESGPVEEANDAMRFTQGPIVAEQTEAVAQAQPSPAQLGPVLKGMEQRGFRAETQSRLVSMELKNGRKLDLPVREVRIRYVGDRTY